jgi:hypothetical protein
VKLKNKYLIIFCLILSVSIGSFYILNQIIILDRTNQELGIHDFVAAPADAEILVEGTGKQIITGELVSTKLKVVKVNWNNTSHKFVEGIEIEANEYFVVHKNRQVSGLQFIPGKSIYSMGTSYKRLKNGEKNTIKIIFSRESNRLWIMPNELIKQ